MNEELKIIIRAELEQFKKAMRDAVSGLKSVAHEGRKASKEIDGFTAEVNQQRNALADLKKKYVDLAKAHGQESKEAKDAAEAIRKLSAEYKTNKALATDLANKANSFDVSLGNENAQKNVNATNESMGELQDTLEGIYTLNIWQFVGDSISKWSKKAKEFGGSARDSFDLAGIYFKQAWGELTRDPETLMNLDAVGESISQSTKGSLESVKYAFQEVAQGVGASFKAIAAGIAASAAIIIADLLVIIGLTKNALTMAKQIKAMANQANKSGMDTASYQEWGYVLKQVGIEEDKLADFTKKLAERQNELRNGSEEVAKAFEEIGLSQEEVLGSSQEELFRKSVMGLQNISNEAERTSLNYRIFSDDAADLANALYLTNQETQSLINNYYQLGGAPSDNLISKSKILGSSTTNLSYAWQGLRNTLAEWVIPAIIKVVQWLTTAIAYVNAFLQGVFGIKVKSSGAADGANQVADGVGRIGSNASSATSAVKELLRYTMGFDELNVIPKQSTNSGSGGGSVGGGAGGFSGANINPEMPVIEVPDLSKFRAFMEEYGSLIQGILTWTAILGGIAMIVGGCMTGNIPLVVAGLSIAGLGIGIGAAGGEESHWAKLGDAIVKVFKAVGEFYVSYWNWLWSLIEPIVSWIYDKVITPIANYCKWLWGKIVEIFTPIVKWFSDLWQSVSDTISSIIDVIVGLFKGGWELIKHIWNNLPTWFDTYVVQPVSTFFSNMWNGLKTKASEAWEGVKTVFKPVADWFEEKFRTAWQKVKDIFSSGGETFEGIKEGIADTFKTVVNHIIGGINTVIKVPFDKINGLLNTLRSTEILGITPFKDFWKRNPLSVPQIPLLAKGGIVDSATLAMIGERGREAVIPLENNTEWMDVLAARINNNAPSKIVLMVDGKELGYAAINNINTITRQTGTLQLQLV
jgi:phage-related protein